MADKKVATIFYCKICDYECKKFSDFDKHNNTRKHKRLTKMSPNDEKYICHCGRIYTHRQSLHKHKKKCKNTEDKLNELLETTKILLKENKEIKNKLNEQTCNQNINNNFNLHFYLNETCKDAYNLKDFISNINIEKSDLDLVLTDGMESGLTNVFIKNLKDIEQNKRPIQCSDSKRDVVYVKDENVWQKDKEKEKLKTSIIAVQNKHILGINKWNTSNIETNSDSYVELASKVSDNINSCIIEKNILKESKIIK